MDKLENMRLFSQVVQLGSFIAVAEKQGITRSMVTRKIASLEKKLGIKLINRNTRRLSLTTAGAQYLEKCLTILDLVDAAESALLQDRRAVRGLIKLSVSVSFGWRCLSPILLDFIKNYPEVTLNIDYADQQLDLIEDGIDIAVRMTNRLRPQEVVRRLGHMPFKVVASPHYLAERGMPQHPSDLTNHPCLIYGLASDSWSFLIDENTCTIPVTGAIYANNAEILLAAAIRGIGVAHLPVFFLGEALKSGQLVEILTDYPSSGLGIHAILSSNQHIPQRIRTLVDFLQEHIQHVLNSLPH